MTIRSIVDGALRRIKMLYKIPNILWGKTRFDLHIIQSDLDILFDIFVHVHSMSNADRLSNLRREWGNSPMVLFLLSSLFWSVAVVMYSVMN